MSAADLFAWGALIIFGAACFFGFGKAREKRRLVRRAAHEARLQIMRADREERRAYDAHARGDWREKENDADALRGRAEPTKTDL